MMMFTLLWVLSLLFLQDYREQVPYSDIEYSFSERIPYEHIFTAYNPSNGDIYLLRQDTKLLVRFTEASQIDTLGYLEFEDNAPKKMAVNRSGEHLFFWDLGVGRVHSYDLSTGGINRIDTSHNHRNLFGHASIIGENDEIYALGGYGYWTYKNLLIKFDPETGQWDEVETLDKSSVTKGWHGMFFRDEDKAYYLIDEPDDPIKETTVFELEWPTKKWSIHETLTEVIHETSISESTRNHKFAQFMNHSVDKESNVFGFITNQGIEFFLNFMDYESEELYRMDLSGQGFGNIRAIFYSTRLEKWILLGHENSTTMDKTITVRSFDLDLHSPFVSQIEYPFLDSRSVIGMTIVILLFSGGLFLWFFMQQKESSRRDDPFVNKNKPVQLYQKEGNGIQLIVNNEMVSISSDPLLLETWELIYQKLSNDIHQIPLSEFDNKIFPNQTHQSQASRNRKRLISIINETCGIPLITEEKSKTDRRYKVLEINSDKIEIN